MPGVFTISGAARKGKRRRGLGSPPEEHRSEVDRVFKLAEVRGAAIEKALRDKDCFGAVAGMLHLYSLAARIETNAASVRHTPQVKHKLRHVREMKERLFTRASGCIRREW